MTSAKIKIDGLEVALKKLEVGPTDVVILNYSPALEHCVLQELHERLPHRNLIVLVPCGRKIEALDEKMMAQHGWVRRK